MLGAGAGIAAWVVVVGGARMWAKLTAIDVPADQTVSVLPRGLLITEGIRTLVVPLLLGGAVAVFVYLSRRAGPEDDDVDGRFVVQDELAAKTAAVLAESKSAEESARAADRSLETALHWAEEPDGPDAELVAGELRGRLGDAQRELSLTALRFRRVAVLAHELDALQANTTLLELGRDASEQARRHAAARESVMQLSGAVPLAAAIAEVRRNAPVTDAETLRKNLRNELDPLDKRLLAGISSLGPIAYGRWWLRRLADGSSVGGAIVVVVVLLAVFTAIALALVDASTGLMGIAAGVCVIAVALFIGLARSYDGPWGGIALIVLVLTLPVVALVGFLGALGLKYTLYVAALTLLTIWFASGALRRATGAAATAWILFVAIAFWSGALAFIAQRGAKVTTLDTVAVFQKDPTPAIAGVYLGRTADAVYLASGEACNRTACRHVIGIPVKQVTCVIFGPFAHVKSNGDVTNSRNQRFGHDPSTELVDLAEDGFGAAPATCAGPKSKVTPPAKSSKTDDHSKTTNHLALFNGLRLVVQRPAKTQPAPTGEVRVIGPFTISLAGSSPPANAVGGGRLVVGTALFEFGRARLTPDARANIAAAVREVKDTEARQVFVAGHADEKGSDTLNVRLALRRAAAVERVLRSRLGQRVTIVRAGYGERLPLACNRRKDGSDDRRSRAVNRRVEIRTRRLMTYEPPACGR